MKTPHYLLEQYGPREAMEYLGIAPLLIKEIIAAQTLEPEQVF